MPSRDVAQIQAIHRSSKHPGVKKMLYFVRLIDLRVTKAEVRAVVRDCRECQAIDPAPVHWKPDRLDVAENWNRVGMDVTHFAQQLYLTLIDCDPSHFEALALPGLLISLSSFKWCFVKGGRQLNC